MEGQGRKQRGRRNGACAHRLALKSGLRRDHGGSRVWLRLFAASALLAAVAACGTGGEANPAVVTPAPNPALNGGIFAPPIIPPPIEWNNSARFEPDILPGGGGTNPTTGK